MSPATSFLLVRLPLNLAKVGLSNQRGHCPLHGTESCEWGRPSGNPVLEKTRPLLEPFLMARLSFP
jgi:hypothetical protein